MRDQNIKTPTRVTIWQIQLRATNKKRRRLHFDLFLAYQHNFQPNHKQKDLKQDLTMAPSTQKLMFAYRLLLAQQDNNGEHQVALEKPGFVAVPLQQEQVIVGARNGDLARATSSCWDCASTEDAYLRDLMHSTPSQDWAMPNPAFSSRDVVGQNYDQETSYKANSSLFHHIPKDEDFKQLLSAEHLMMDDYVSVASLYWSEAEIRYMTHRGAAAEFC
jgi:hypothetical protein